jgi:hypothetical protein
MAGESDGDIKTWDDTLKQEVWRRLDAQVVDTDDIPPAGIVKGPAHAPGFYLDGARVAAPFEYMLAVDFNPSNISDWTTPINNMFAAAQAIGGGIKTKLPERELTIGGPLLDTAKSNAQILLPEVPESQQFSLTVEGTGTPSMGSLGPALGGTRLKSTLTSGNGAVFGVKSDLPGNVNNRTALHLTLRDLTLIMPPDPTISGFDLNWVWHPEGYNIFVTTDEDFDQATEPTTPGSVGIKMPLANVPSNTYFRDVVIAGMRRGVDWAELTRFQNLTCTNCLQGIFVRQGVHPSTGHGIVLVDCKYPLYADPAATEHYFNHFEFSTERSTLVSHPSNPWYITAAEVYDPDNIIHGEYSYLLDLPFATAASDIIQVGGRYFIPRDVTKPYNNRNPTEIFSGFRSQNNAVMEVHHGAPTSNANNAAWVSLITNRTDDSGIVGGVALSNESLSTDDKRLAQMAGVTAGSPDSGAWVFATRAAGGGLVARVILDSVGGLQLLTPGKGLTLPSENGTIYEVTVNNAGTALVITPV